MQLSSYLQPENIRCKVDLSSKKKALVLLSEILSSEEEELNQDVILSKLKERERLGSTALGAGIAIPHCRVAGLSQAKLAFISLNEAIDYDAADKQAIDLLFCLLVPEDCTTDHLQILAMLAGMLKEKANCKALRECTQADAVHQYIVKCPDAAKQDAA